MIEKAIFVNKGNQFYYKCINKNRAIFEDLCLSHKEADEKLPMPDSRRR